MSFNSRNRGMAQLFLMNMMNVFFAFKGSKNFIITYTNNLILFRRNTGTFDIFMKKSDAEKIVSNKMPAMWT